MLTFHLSCFRLCGTHNYQCREVSLHVDAICVTIIQYIQSLSVYIQIGNGDKELSCSLLPSFSIFICVIVSVFMFYMMDTIRCKDIRNFKTLRAWTALFDQFALQPVLQCLSQSKRKGGEGRMKEMKEDVKKTKRERGAYLCKELRQAAAIEQLADTLCVGVAGPGE